MFCNSETNSFLIKMYYLDDSVGDGLPLDPRVGDPLLIKLCGVLGRYIFKRILVSALLIVESKSQID